MAELGGIKHDLGEIPHWVWIGVAGAGTLLWVLTRGKGTGGQVANPATLPLSTDPGTPTAGGSTSSTDYSGALANLQAEIAALQTAGGAAGGPAPVGQPATPDQSTIPSPFVAHLPTAIFGASGLLPTTSSPTDAGLSMAQQGVQDQLGVYGGAPVKTTNPFAGVGGGWDGVTQTTYQGGGIVTNLGIAQPAPAVGQIVPPAVQTPFGGPSYIYANNFQPGQTQQSGDGTLAGVLQGQIAGGGLSQAQARQSWDNTPASIRGSGPNPFA